MAAVERQGKYLVVRLLVPAPAARAVLVIHLGMSGQLLLATSDDGEVRHTHVRLAFEGGRELRFVDPRTFGEMFVADAREGAGPLPELAHLGPDALLDLPTPAALAALLAPRRSQLKPLLMNQRFVAGIGNIYSDEILHRARLRFDRRSETLSSRDVARLHRATNEVLAAAIAARGSSLADEQYRDVFGVVGRYQEAHQVYGREGEPCPRCGRAIMRIPAGGRSTFLCPRCPR